MNTGIWILIVVVGILGGATGGFFLARNYMKKYFEKNPPINEEMISAMMSQMGQKPSAKKLNQMMASMKAQSKSSKK